MTVEELHHAIRAACTISGDREVWMFGSQAILGRYPDAPESLLTSIVVDLQPKNRPDTIDQIDGPLGELSMFHQTHGFYVHCFPITAIQLPDGWESRVIKLKEDGPSGFIGLCLEPHDLAASKLAANREKDRDYVRTLLIEGMISAEVLLTRITTTPLDDTARGIIRTWVVETARAIEQDPPAST